MRRLPALLLFLLPALGYLCIHEAPAGTLKSSDPETVRIAIVGSLFRDVPEPLIMALMQPFNALMEEQTGLNGQVMAAGDALDLGQKLVQDKVDIGIFTGIEFAWARQKFSELRPLLIVINQKRHLYAYLVVRNDSGIADFADLKGKSLTLSRRSREHCYQFLWHHIQRAGANPQSYFSQVSKSANAEDALDDVVEGKVQATIVEQVAFDGYQRLKPGRFSRLKVVHESEAFPAAVVVYREGALDDAVLRRFREGLLGADKNPIGRQLLTLWHLTAFEPVPADYQETLTNIVKTYPPPASSAR